MPESTLPRAIQDFVLRHLHSVEQLEALLFMRRNAPAEFPAVRVSMELRTDLESIVHKLEDLVGRGFVTRRMEGTANLYRFAPKDPVQAEAVEAFAKSYTTHRVAIINLIFSRPTESLRSFVDAFKIRKEGE